MKNFLTGLAVLSVIGMIVIVGVYGILHWPVITGIILGISTLISLSMAIGSAINM